METGITSYFKFLYCGILLLFLGFPAQGYIYSDMRIENPASRDVSFVDAVKEISQRFNVFFTFDLELVEGITVDDAFRRMDDVENAVEYVLHKTDLNYRIIDTRYVIIYKNDQEGINSLKEMSRHLDGLISEGENSPSVLKRTVRATPKLPANRNIKKIERIVFTVSGIVTDQEGEPLIGVNIQVKGSSKGTATDFDGRFTLEDIDENAVLVISYVGYQTQEVPIAGKSGLEIVMMSDSQLLDEVVVVGYGTQKKSDLTGSIAKMDASNFESQSMTQLTDMLTGTVAGVNINQGTSASGDNSFMEIRGRTSLTASNQPMIVLDGAIFNGSLSDINPNDVESIEILKDASSAAIYGSRASNGVIMITSKSGINSKPTIQFKTELGMTQTAHDYKPYNGNEYVKFRSTLLKDWSAGTPSYYYDNPENLPEGISINEWRELSSNPVQNNTQEWLNRLNFFDTEVENFMEGKEMDWYNTVMRNGVRQNYDLSINGISGNLNYYWSAGYVANEGIILGDDFSSVRTKLNLDFEVASWLSIGMNTMFTYRDASGVPASLTNMYRASPYGSMYEDDGNLKFYVNEYIESVNPLVNTYNQKRVNDTKRLFSTIYSNVKLPFNINYKLSFQPHYRFSYDYNFWPSETTITGGISHLNGYGTREESQNFEWILDNIINWNGSFGSHALDITLLYSAEEYKSWLLLNTNENFAPNENLLYHGLHLGTNPSMNNNDSRSTATAIMGRMNYSYLSKYLLTFSVRRDGYSAFGQRNPFATFPSVAFGWRISEESFFKSKIVDDLKLRLSWGVNGNRSIGVYSALAEISPNLSYDGANTIVGVYNNTLANPNLSWESSAAFNIGIDAILLNGRIEINGDIYDLNTTDLLMKRALPEITGFTSIMANLGKVNNKGFELAVNSFNIDKSTFKWNSTVSFSMNRNKILQLFGDMEEVTENGQTFSREIPDYSNEWFPGEAIDRIWNYNIIGIWQENEKEMAESYNMVPGDVKSEDVNHDNSYQQLDDKQFIGYTQPRYRIGFFNSFSYKNLMVSLFLRSELGHLREFPYGLQTAHSTVDRRSWTPAPDYWTPDNPINDYPRILTSTNAYGGGIKMYKPSSFVRLQDLTLSYRLDSELFQRYGIQDPKIYGSIRNLFTVTKWPGWDPESGNSPMPRIFSIGLSFSI